MERETWKNAGLAGAAMVALGCGAMWYSSRENDDAPPQIVTVNRPVRIVEATPPRPPKPTIVASNQPTGRPPRPNMEKGGVHGRLDPKKPKDAKLLKEKKPPAA